MRIDEEEVARVLEGRKDVLLARIRREVGEAVSTMSASQALTFLWMDGERTVRSMAPAVSADYARTLIAFTQGWEIGGCRVESAVTPAALSAAREAVIRFYASPDTGDAIVAAFLARLEAQLPAGRTDGKLAEQEDPRAWLARELKAEGGLSAVHSLGGDLVAASAGRLNAFFQTALGRKILLALGKAFATSAGKVMVLRLVQGAVQKVMASAALQSAILAALQKIGLGTLVKSAIGKAVIALLAMGGVTHVPLVLVVLPVIAGFLVLEYRRFPRKLADRLPGEVADAVGGSFAEMNRSITAAILAGTVAALEGDLTKPRNETA